MQNEFDFFGGFENASSPSLDSALVNFDSLDSLLFDDVVLSSGKVPLNFFDENPPPPVATTETFEKPVTPLTLPPLTSVLPTKEVQKTQIADEEKVFSQPKKNSLPFSFGASHNRALFVPKKQLVKSQDLCSTTTRQVAEDVQLIGKEKAKVRQLPQPQMHGVASVNRNETEREFLAQCDVGSIEKIVLTAPKRKRNEDEKKTTNLLERDEIPSDIIRKRGRKPKSVELESEDPVTLLATMLTNRKGFKEFEAILPKKMRSDIDLLLKCGVQCESFHDVAEKVQNLFVYRFVALLFKQNVTGKATLQQTDFVAEASQIVTKAFSQGGVQIWFPDRLIWVIAVLSHSAVKNVSAETVLNVVCLFYSQEALFRLVFRSLFLVKDGGTQDLLDLIFKLAKIDCLEEFAYFAVSCLETKCIGCNAIAENLCSRIDGLEQFHKILSGKPFLDARIRHHLFVYFYRLNPISPIEQLAQILTTSNSLIDVAELLVGERTADKHALFLQSLTNSTVTRFINSVCQHQDASAAKDAFQRLVDFEVLDYQSTFNAHMNDELVSTDAPMTFSDDSTCYIQLPVFVKRENCVFCILAPPQNRVFELLQMITDPPQILFVSDSVIEENFHFFVSLVGERKRPDWFKPAKKVEFLDYKNLNAQRLFPNALKRTYIEPQQFASRISAQPPLENSAEKYVKIQHDSLTERAPPTFQFIDIDFLKALVSRAYEAPKEVTASEFVEAYCQKRNNLITRENY